jgi:hypothetical protein
MFAADLHDLYKHLNDSLSLPAEEVNDIATKLLEAPEDQSVSRKMRLEAIVMHSNFSRNIYDRIFWEFPNETLVSEDTNILHMLISNPNATLEDIQTLSDYAKDHGKSEWFETVVMKTIDLSEYQLNLTYNGEYIFQDETIRKNLAQTSELLHKFFNPEPTN